MKYGKKVEKLLRIEFDSKPVYGNNDKYIETKIKGYGSSVNTNFQDKKLPKEKVPWKHLSIIMLDSVIKANKKHYPQTLLDEGKHEPKKITKENLLDDDLKKSSSDESHNDSNDEIESNDETDNDESNE